MGRLGHSLRVHPGAATLGLVTFGTLGLVGTTSRLQKCGGLSLEIRCASEPWHNLVLVASFLVLSQGSIIPINVRKTAPPLTLEHPGRQDASVVRKATLSQCLSNALP